MKRYIEGIDGLRAVAVCAVLAFHAFPNMLPGGFIGVDIFFVISGYIITKTYYDRLQNRKTSLGHFYIKRVRRLAPIYLIVIIATSLVAYVVLSPVHLKNYSLSLGAQPLYLQNFVFWGQGDYFDGPLTRPLLHTWSLAIEEQFYLLYGVLILIAIRLPKIAFALILISVISSYAIGEMLAVASPKTTFFLLPARLWEFGIGILVARMPRFYSPTISVCLRIIGLTMVGASLTFFDETALFPGIQSLLACSGASLVLFTLSASGSKSIVLELPIMTYLGRISYALYLWHWPIIALSSVYLGRNLAHAEAAAALFVSWLLAHSSHIFIEEPVRRGSIIRKNVSLLTFIFTIAVCLLGVAIVLFQTHGATFRYSPELVKLYEAQQKRSPYRCSYLKRIMGYPSRMCLIAEPDAVSRGSVLVLGDSHADQLDEMLAAEGAKRGFEVFLTTRNCTPAKYGETKYCSLSELERLTQEIKQRKIEYIFVIAFRKSSISVLNIERSIELLLQAGVKRVFLMQTVPNGAFFDPAERIKALESGLPFPEQYYVRDQLEDAKVQRQIVSELGARHNRVSIIDATSVICPDKCKFEQMGRPLYFDSHHLSPTGANILRPLFAEVFSDLVLNKYQDDLDTH